jgi:glutaredoxin
MNKIFIFTLNTCGHCHELKKSLNELEIDFTELEVTKNLELWQTVVNKVGNDLLPTIFVSINGGDTGPIFMPERDYKTKDDIIKIIKNYHM